jgi:membrane protein YqaA with SNARE-associated domain
MAYLSLFLSSFISATLFPLNSEVVLVALLSQGFQAIPLILVATIGNSLGSFTTYYVGRLGSVKWLKRFGYNQNKESKYKELIERHGFWLGFLAWVPFVGDIFVLFLGFFKVPFLPSALAIFVGKAARYTAIYVLFDKM